MGKFLAPGRLSGRVYDITIKGDTPSPTEQARIKAYVDEQESLFQQNFAETMGFELAPPDDGTAFGRGFSRGVEDARGSLGELLQTLGQRTGFQGLEEYGAGMENTAALNAFKQSLTEPAPLSFRDVRGLGSGLTYLGELAGSSAPVMGGIAAGAGIGALAGAPAVLGGALAATPYYMGSIMQEQERNYGEDNVNLGTALAGGAVAAALDSASLGVLGRLGIGKAALGALSGEVGRGLTMRLLTGAGAGALTEGTTETLQEVTQLLAAGTDPNSPEVQDRLLEAFVGGGVLGGVVGGVGRGAFGKRPEGATPPPAATPLAAAPPAAGPQFQFDDTGQGKLFADLAEAKAPAAPTEIPPNLRRPDTTGLPLFDVADATNRPATTVLDSLGIAPTAPIRKRLADSVETDPKFVAELTKYAAMPGLKKEQKAQIKAYLDSRTAPTAPAAPPAAPPAAKVPQPKPAPQAGTQGTAGTAPTEQRVMQVLKKAREQQAAGKNQLVSKSGAQALVDAGLLSPEDMLIAPTANARVADLLALGPDEVKARMAKPADAAPAPEAKVETPAPEVNAAAEKAAADAEKAAADAAAEETAKDTTEAPATTPAPEEAAAPPPAEAPNLNAPLVPQPTLRVPGGPTILGASQLIPEPGIRPVQGKQLETQAAAQRESVARQLSTKAKLEEQMASLREQIGQGKRIPDSTRAVAKKLGITAKDHVDSLRREMRRLKARHYNIMSYLNSEAGRAQAETEGTTNQDNIRRRAENDAARVAYRAWYDANTPTEIKAYDADIRGEGLKVAPVIMPETGVAAAMDPKDRARLLAQEAAEIDALDPTTVEDKAKLLVLIRTKPNSKTMKGVENENARAAYAYFSKSRDIADALDNIAADAAMPDIPGKRVGTKREALHPYWKGTGKEAAMKAAQWVEDNLSEDTLAYMDEKIGTYAEDTAMAAGDVIDRQIKNTRANEEADQKTLGEYYKAMSAIDNADVSQELGIESGVFERESLRPMRARNLGADRDFINEIGIDIGDFLRNKPASIAFGLEAPLHPTIIKALRAGNLRVALEALSATSTDPYISQLAKSLIPFLGDTKVYTTRSGSPRAQAETRRLLTDVNTGAVHPGSYILMTEANFRASEAISPTYANAIQNSILLDEATGMNAHTILHEVLHPVTLRELMTNPNGPVARRLETLRQQVFDAIGKEFEDRGEEVPYGLTSVAEFVTEALSNQHFQGILDRLYPTTKKVNALEQILRTLANFVRTRILRKPAKVYADNRVIPSRMRPDQESVFDEVDRLVRSIFNTAPEFGVYEPLFDTARRPAAAAQALDSIALRMRPFAAVDSQKFDNAVAVAGKAERGAMSVTMNLFTPVRNLIDLAEKYFPAADRVFENLTKNSQYKQKLSSEMWNTLTAANSWLDKHPQLEQAFHSLRTRASKQEIDPRLPEKFYNSFVVRYYKYNPDGSIGEPKYEDFASASEARDFITKINDAEANGAATTKAKLLFTPDKENAALHRKFKDELEVLEAQAPGAKKAYREYLNIAERLHREAGKALKQRIDAMYPGNENAYTRNTLLRGQYNKIFAERGLLAYQPLIREGSWRISYSGVHPDTNTVEPFVHYVGSLKEARRAKEILEALPAEYKITEIAIAPRGIDAPYGKKSPVPSTYVSDVVRALEAAAVKDADAAGRAALAAGKPQAEADAERERVFALLKANASRNAETVVELALNALPESSIFSAYRARTGVSGFTGDLSPLKAAFDELENTFDAPDVSRGMFEQFMAGMVQKVAAIQQQADADLVRQYLNDRLAELAKETDSGRMSERQYEKAVTYHQTLTAALNNPTIQRMQIVNDINTGAYMFTLLGNISSVAMNLLGAVTFVYPRLAARYGPAEAAKMMLKSIRTISGSGRMRLEPVIGPDGQTTYEDVDAGVVGRSMRNYKFSGVDHTQGFNTGNNKTNALEYLVREGEKRHMLVDSLVYDYIDSNKTRFEPLNKLMYWGSAPLHHVERVVRESAMLANYDLELRRMANEKGSDVLTQAEMEEAARTAVREAELMTGTIPATAAPNWAQRGIMPNIAMYKRYPLAMLHMIIRDIARSVPTKAKLAEMYGADTVEFNNALQERKIARLQVASVLGSMALFAGAMGMPLYGMVADLWDALFTDSDEEGFDTLVRMGIGELGSKGILNYLFGLEFSSRIGLSDIFYRTPLRAEDQPFLWNLIEGLGGPGVSIVSGWTTRTTELLDQGEYFRALESALPAAVRNVLRGGRFLATGGAESLRDDIISDISPGQALAQALGFAPSSYIRQIELNSEAKRIEQGVASKKTRIMRALNMARRNGDTDAYQDAWEQLQEFNREHPDQFVSSADLEKSRKTFARNSEKVRNGVVYTDPQAYALEDVMRLMEEPASIWD